MIVSLDTSVALGNDHHCDYCGWSYNMLDYSYGAVDRLHALTVRTGCFGGDELETYSTAEAAAFVRAQIPYAEHPPNLEDLALAIEALAHPDQRTT